MDYTIHCGSSSQFQRWKNSPSYSPRIGCRLQPDWNIPQFYSYDFPNYKPLQSFFLPFFPMNCPTTSSEFRWPYHAIPACSSIPGRYRYTNENSLIAYETANLQRYHGYFISISWVFYGYVLRISWISNGDSNVSLRVPSMSWAWGQSWSFLVHQ